LGHKIAEENYVNDTLDGVYKLWYPDGKIKVVQSYLNGVPQGVRREYDEEGNITAGYIFDRGKIVGEGIVKEDGLKEGPWKEFYPNGKLKAEGNYAEGVKTGKWTYYYKNGQVEQTGSYDKKGRPKGDWVWYYPSGALLREESYMNGLLDGMWSEYAEDGTVIAQGEYIEGMEEGPWEYRYGDYREEGSYSYGMRNGVWKSFAADGTLLFEGEFIDTEGNFKGILRGRYGKGQGGRSLFVGYWLDRDNHRIGILKGHWRDEPQVNGGVFTGRWAKLDLCAEVNSLPTFEFDADDFGGYQPTDEQLTEQDICTDVPLAY